MPNLFLVINRTTFYLRSMQNKILLLGSGELGKELVIALKRLGQYVIAVDNYANAPAMQVADVFNIIDMLDGEALDRIVAFHKPDLIVPEIEAIRTERLYHYEAQGIQIVPSAKAANFTMNRKEIRDFAAKEMGVQTAKYKYASTSTEFEQAVSEIGLPCVVKPLMSSSGKGQSVIKSASEIQAAWEYAIEGSRGDVKEVIIEEFIPFEYEITLLTVTQKNGPTLFCAPIGHRQERGDYQESWQPMPMKTEHLIAAQEMAKNVAEGLGGAGIWGVEFFITANGPVFSELSPRPHDTGMVTLANTQNLSEFELHARAILGLPIPTIVQITNGASAVLLAHEHANSPANFEGIQEVLKHENTDVRLFGKPTMRPFRRMGVVLVNGTDSVERLTQLAKDFAAQIVVKS